MVRDMDAAEASASKPDDSASKPSSSAHRPLANGLSNNPTPSNRGKSRASSGVAAPNWRGPHVDATQTVSNGDPFKRVAGHSNAGSKVSGGVPVVTPGQVPTNLTFLSQHLESGDESDDKPSQPVIVATPRPTASAALAPEDGNGKGKQKAVEEPTRTSNPTSGTRDLTASPTRATCFTTDVAPSVEGPGCHYVKVHFKCYSKGVEPVMDTAYNAFGWSCNLRGVSSIMLPEGPETRFPALFLCFDDTRYAKKAVRDAKVIDYMGEVTCVTQSEYAAGIFHYGTTLATAPYDGQVIFAARFEGEGAAFDKESLFDEVRSLALKYGRLVHMADAHIFAGTWEFRAEYCKISVAQEVAKLLTEAKPAKINGWSVFAREYTNGNALVLRTPHKPIQRVNGEYAASPTGRTSWKFDEDGNTVLGVAPVRVPKARPHAVESLALARGGSTPTPELPSTDCFGRDHVPSPRSQSWNGPTTTNFMDPMIGPGDRNQVLEGPQIVDIDRIRRGHDVRTTLMLRNLPNSLDAAYLKEKILDIATRNKYDFSYLRFDFERGVNVGYAFVNFTNPAHIITFVEHWTDAVWAPTLHLNNRTRPRMAEMAYATTQGIECSIAKFRNSSVMLEAPPYRPKLWWSAEQAPDPSMIGKERPFPPPDNDMKLQRSCANASQVGLFAPARRNDGHGGRGGRGRQQRSQFDRGTLAQIQEDAMMNNFGGAVYPGQYQGPLVYDPMNGTMVPAPPHVLAALNNVDSFGHESPVNAIPPIMPPNFNGFNPNFINHGFDAAPVVADGERAMIMGGAVQSPTFAGPTNHRGSYHGNRQHRGSYTHYNHGFGGQPEAYHGHQNGHPNRYQNGYQNGHQKSQGSSSHGYYPPPNYQ